MLNWTNSTSNNSSTQLLMSYSKGGRSSRKKWSFIVFSFSSLPTMCCDILKHRTQRKIVELKLMLEILHCCCFFSVLQLVRFGLSFYVWACVCVFVQIFFCFLFGFGFLNRYFILHLNNLHNEGEKTIASARTKLKMEYTEVERTTIHYSS